MTDPTPLTIQQIVAAYQAALAAEDVSSTQRLSASYLRAFERLEAQQAALLAEIEADQQRGIQPTRGKIVRMRRYQSLIRQTREELDRFSIIIGDDAQNQATDGATQGAQLAADLVQGSLEGLDPGVQASIMATFDQLPTEAVEAIVGALQEDSPLFDTVLSRYGEAHTTSIGQALIDNVLQGRNPRVTARAMTTQWGIPLTDALRISRTEHNRAARTATLATYRTNPHLVKGWRWMAALDPRTCLSCVNLHGTLFPLTETLDDHPNGRCTMAPQMISFADLGINLPELDLGIEEGAGQAWFAEQDEATQRQMMGPAKFEAWKAGLFEFSQLSKETTTPRWGRMFSEAPLKDMVSPAEQKTAPPPLQGPTGIREFKDDADLARLNQEADIWSKGLVDEERAAVVSWTGTDYKRVRKEFVEGTTRTPETFELMSTLEAAPSVRGRPVYRGIKVDLPRGEVLPAMERTVGTRIRWDAPASASLDPKIGWGFSRPGGIVFEIIGSDARYIAPLSDFDIEREAVVLPGSEFDVVRVTKGKIRTDFDVSDAILVVLHAVQ